MQRALSVYELGKADYAWALGQLDDSRMEHGIYGAARRIDRWDNRLASLLRWMSAAIALIVMVVIAVFVAQQFGPTSTVALAAYALVPIVPGLLMAGLWLWAKWELWGVGNASAKSLTGPLLKKIDRGDVPLPMGSVEVAWDQDAPRLTGGGHVMEVAWSARPIVHREGDRVLVMPFTPNLGTPDLKRLAIVRAEAFSDLDSLTHTVEAWSSHARG